MNDPTKRDISFPDMIATATTAPLISRMTIEIDDLGTWAEVEIYCITVQHENVRMIGPRSTLTVRPRHCRNFRINGEPTAMPAFGKFQTGFSVGGI